MAATGFTPISLYYSTTASTAPTAGNLVAGELAINTTDGKLYYKDTAGVVQLLASKDSNSGSFTNISVSSVATFGAGTVSAPSITFTGDTNTGIYSPAADTIAFTEGGVEAMRINSSANVGIGTNSPTYKLDVTGTDGNVFRTQFNSIGIVNFIGSDAGYTGTSTNHPLAFVTNGSERMRIDSAGNVGIGTASPSDSQSFGRAVDTRGANGAAYYAATSDNTTRSFFATFTGAGYTGTETNHPFLFRTSNTERMRITSGGDLCVQSSTYNTAGYGFFVGNDGATTTRLSIGGSNSSDATGISLYSTGAGAFRFFVSYGGTVNATSTTISAISDARLKENIQDIDVGLDALMLLKPRKFDWKTGKGKNIKGDRGWIAQEFETVFPEMINEWLDPAPEGEEPYKSVAADLIPVLVKAVQELKAELDSVKAELQTLKGN